MDLNLHVKEDISGERLSGQLCFAVIFLKFFWHLPYVIAIVEDFYATTGSPKIGNHTWH